MKKIVFFIILYLSFLGNLHAQLHEVRAVWISTIGGLDWPHSYSQSSFSMLKQQQEFCDILDRLAHAGINTVILQTRIRATTIFPPSPSSQGSGASGAGEGRGKAEPWDGCLSGFPGKSPGYDALEFCINECHKRGMKLHAWVVTLPVGKWNGAGCRALRKACPNLLKRIKGEVYMNPEKTGTADYLAAFCKDLASRYDIDGIHLDYCRYPDGWGTIKNPEKGRENITRIVRAISKEVRSVKPWIQMSCSPVGKYADTKRQWAHGWNARDVVCQDAVAWLSEGLMDALYPMMYFRNENFYPFAIDWKERSLGKIIAPGLGIYFLDPHQKNWSLEDCTRELWVLRQYGMGNCLFRSKFFTDNTKGIYDFYNNCYGALPAIQPPMTWLSDRKPETPSNLVIVQNNKGIRISWNALYNLAYNVYGSDTYPVDISKAENLLAENLQQNSISLTDFGKTIYYAITATDRYGNESAPLQQHIRTCDTIEVSISDIAPDSPIIISSIVGNDICSVLVKTDGNKNFISIGNLPVGHYTMHSISRKGRRHLIGRFDVKP